MKYAIKRYDGAIFPERYLTRAEAQRELNYKLGNGGSYGLAWIVEIEPQPHTTDLANLTEN